jgi:hypothetical protein
MVTDTSSWEAAMIPGHDHSAHVNYFSKFPDWVYVGSAKVVHQKAYNDNQNLSHIFLQKRQCQSMDPLSYLRIVHLWNIPLVQLKLRIIASEDAKTRIARKDSTHICIEGYPRSANTFSYHLFLYANPGEKGHVAHHTHAMANIERALRYQIPTILLIRNPIDAVLSAYVKNAFNIANFNFLVQYYITFYEWLKPRKDEVIVADFDVVTNDFNRVINQVNEKHNASFQRVINFEEARKQVIDFLKSPKYYTGKMLGNKALYHLNVPSDQKEEKKEEFRSLLLAHKKIGVAQCLYEQMIS